MEEHYLQQELYDLVKSDTGIFEFIQSGALDGLWYWDLEQIEHEWLSPKFWTTLGYDPEDKKHLASEWQNIINEEDLALSKENLEKHCADPDYPYDQIVRYKHKNGSTVWIRCRGMAIRDSMGKPVRMLGAHTDITDLKIAERELSRISSEYEKVFNGTQDAVFLLRVVGPGQFRFIRNNLAHQHKTGILADQIRDKSPQDLLGEELGNIVAKNYQKCVESKRVVTYEEELALPEGTRFWQTTLTPILEQGNVAYIVGSATDLTERKNLEFKLEKYAHYDTLTGISNRRLFFEYLERIICERGEESQKFSLLYIDLDGFKYVNDTHGHEAGDAVLIAIANRLLQSIRNTDFVARLGGDEFAVILNGNQSFSAVQQFAITLHDKIEEPITMGPLHLTVSASIGIAIFPDSGEDTETLMRNADVAMYDIKKNGKGGIKIYSKQVQ
jgi:histidinol-phosphatase (PHP family)